MNQLGPCGKKHYLYELCVSSIVMEFADDGDVYNRIVESQSQKVYMKEKMIWKILI